MKRTIEEILLREWCAFMSPFDHKERLKYIAKALTTALDNGEVEGYLPVRSTGQCKTTHNACDCIIQQLRKGGLK